MVQEAHETALSHGWWDEKRSFLECIALVHSELGEATEAYRKGEEENLVEELADTCIRIFDLCGYSGWDLEAVIKRKMSFNKTRSYRHGNKLK